MGTQAWCDQFCLATLQELAGGGGATDTLVINRPSARLGGSLPPRDSGKAAAAAGGADTDTIALGGGGGASKVAAPPAPAPSASQQQLTAGLTEQLQGGRTSHTIHSGSTVGSDDPTAPMKTPATGLSNRTASSTGSLGEEATVSLRKPGGGGRTSGEGAAPGGALGGELAVTAAMAGCQSAMHRPARCAVLALRASASFP